MKNKDIAGALEFLEQPHNYSARDLMSAYYDRQDKRNKKRVDILRLDGSRAFRFYDYGSAEYLQVDYAETFSPDKFIIKIFEVKAAR